MSDLTDQEKWEQILKRSGFHLVSDIKEFAAKTCPPTPDNLFSIGVKALGKRCRKLRIDYLDKVFVIIENADDDYTGKGTTLAQALLDALYKAYGGVGE